ncbi:MAG: hypothetical protein R3B57_11420 [Phycisphaerales bacterium]
MDHHEDHQEYVPDHLVRDEDREFDALADLFLGDAPLAPGSPAGDDRPAIRATGTAPSPAPRPRVVTKPHARIEGIMLGHLPVRAGIWVRQYAASVADATHAPVALLRHARELTTLDLVGPGTPRDIEPCETLEEAIDAARAVCSRWIVRVDEVDEPGLTDASGIDEVTVLTGADEAAVVASYRLVKSLGGEWDGKFGEDEGPRLRLAIMGSVAEQATAAGEKLERAARAFLRRPVQVSARVPRIGANASASIFRGQAETTIEDMLGRIRGEQKRPQLRLAKDDAAAHEVEIRYADHEATPSPAPAERKPEIVVRPQGGRQAAPTPERHIERSLPLSSLIPGLTGLEARCPKAGSVELAADDLGRLHLLASSGKDPTHPMDRLIAAAAWAREHLPLLLRAEPTLAMPSAERDEGDAFTLHLVTRHPKLIRPLLDADVRVHLLTEVEVGGQTARVTTELN